MAENRGIQRLYLEKDDNGDSNIYVNTIRLPQHQYDGIRFLYKQYKKGKAGVILNDPSGYGKRVQTVLFINAMDRVMTLPTLILCNEGTETVWTQQFRQWTNMGSDVFVQRSHEYTRLTCVIGTLNQIPVFSRREWGILVVDDNNVSREALRAAFTARYKIWLTSFDMQKHLQTFSLIYKWLYPKDKFIVENFLTDKKPAALLTNSARLDAFMEDIVIRRRHVTVPLEKPSCATPAYQKVTRKNKDATGRKIKRSKRLPDSDHDTSAESQETGARNISVEDKDKNKSIEDFLVNIENEGVIKMESEDIYDKLTIASNRNNEVTNNSIIKSRDVQDISDEMDIDSQPDYNEVPKSDSPSRSDTQDDIMDLLNNDNVDSQSLIIKYDSDTQDFEFENEITSDHSEITNEINNISEDLYSTDIAKSDNKNEKVNNHDTNAKANLNNSEKLFSEDMPTNRVSGKIKTDGVKCKINELVNKML